MAITKERLEELIEQEAVVYTFNAEWVLDNKSKPQFHNNILVFLCNCDKCGDKKLEIHINDFYETKQEQLDTIHASKYINMERVEKLSLPFWSEITNKVIGFVDGHLTLSKEDNLILIYNNSKKEYFYSKPLMQENYAEACEIIKKIWEGKQ